MISCLVILQFNLSKNNSCRLKLSQIIKLKVICSMQHDIGHDVVVGAGHGPGGQH